MEEQTALVVAETAEVIRRVPEALAPPQLLALAVDRGASVDNLERLLALQERWEANEARKAFVAALAKFRAAGTRVLKNRRADRGRAGGFTYADFPQVVNVVTPVLSECDLAATFTTSQEGNKITVACNLSHAAGHSVSVSLHATPDDGPGRTALMAIASTVTFLKRHTLLAILGLATEDDADNPPRGEPQREYGPDERADRAQGKAQTKVDNVLAPASEQQIARLKEMLGDANISEAKRDAIAKALAEPKLTRGKAGALIGEGKKDAKQAEQPRQIEDELPPEMR